jgi:hypothetical protein
MTMSMPLPYTRAVFACLICLSGLEIPTANAAPGDANYSVTFDVTWSAVTHPQNFPASAHFSGLVGGTHSAAVQFWTPDTPASLGIQRMAEWGQQTTLAGEVQDAVAAGTAGSVILGPAVSALPGSATALFTATPAFPLVTLTTMIAPSPDWFVGVMGLDLKPGGVWAEELTVTLYPWDAGTDSGVTYTSSDLPTVPHVPLYAITGAPFTPGAPIGTFTFRLQSVAAVPPAVMLSARAYPNPFNPQVTIAWEAPAGIDVGVTVYDAAGRRVREVWRGPVAADEGRATWDGRDDTGRTVAAGSYVYVVNAGAHRTSGRLTLVK